MTENQSTGRWEFVAVAFVIVCVIVIVFAEYILAALAFFAALATLLATLAVVVWAWRFIQRSLIEFDAQRQTLAIQAAMAKQQLLLTDKQSKLVYARDGFMPIAFDEVVNAQNHSRLLDLAAQRIETLRIPENVPNSVHIVTHTDTEQTLNQAANVPSVTGSLGDLSFLLPGGQSGKYRLVEEADTDDSE